MTSFYCLIIGLSNKKDTHWKRGWNGEIKAEPWTRNAFRFSLVGSVNKKISATSAGTKLQNKEKTCGRELLTAGVAEAVGFEPTSPWRLPDFEFCAALCKRWKYRRYQAVLSADFCPFSAGFMDERRSKSRKYKTASGFADFGRKKTGFWEKCENKSKITEQDSADSNGIF